jgi:hypothetical protein
LIENKRVIGPEKDVTEVLNAIKVYEKFRGALKLLMKNHF